MTSAKTAGAAKPRKPWGWHTRFRGHKQDEPVSIKARQQTKETDDETRETGLRSHPRSRRIDS